MSPKGIQVPGSSQPKVDVVDFLLLHLRWRYLVSGPLVTVNQARPVDSDIEKPHEDSCAGFGWLLFVPGYLPQTYRG